MGLADPGVIDVTSDYIDYLIDSVDGVVATEVTAAGTTTLLGSGGFTSEPYWTGFLADVATEYGPFRFKH